MQRMNFLDMQLRAPIDEVEVFVELFCLMDSGAPRELGGGFAGSWSRLTF